MFHEKVSLSANDILEQDFKVDTKGYRPQEVDRFLDIIIKDYTEFNNIIKNYEDEVIALKEEIVALKHELRNAKINVDVASRSDKEVTNLDIIRRLSQLEKIVYGNDDN